jgi:hypothetical protein
VDRTVLAVRGCGCGTRDAGTVFGMSVVVPSVGRAMVSGS